MKKLILATASVLALGLAGTGTGYAQTTSPGTTPPASTMQSPSATAPQQAQNGTSSASLSEDQIKEAQQKLKTAGVYNGEINGQMDQETQEAIEQFQEQKGLEKTGTLDQQTMAALNATTSTSGSSMTPSEQNGQNGQNETNEK